MNWDDLRIVAAINRSGSFTRAARQLDVDETTIARRLARIEASLGVTLFTAADGRRHPTEDCSRILTHLAAMERASDAISTVLTEPEKAHRRLHLSTIGAIASYYLAPALPDLLDAEPELILSLDTSDHNIAMSRWEADFALRLGRPKHGEFTVRRIGTLPFSLVRPRAMTARPMIAAYPQSLVGTPEMDALGRRFGAIGARLITSDLMVMEHFVASGRGIAMVPSRVAEGLENSGAVVVESLGIEREVWMLMQPHLRDDRLARRVADWCVKLFAASSNQPKV